MTIEEWRKVTDKLSTNNLNDLTLAAAYLQEYYGKDNEYSKRLMDVYSQIVDIKLDLLTQLIKEHPNEKELELLFSEED